MSKQEIDPRGPRFGAGITAVLLLIVVYLSLNPSTFSISVSLLGIIVALFAIGAFLGNSKHP
jgi:phosphate starvation-inducible membrane PsiE